MRGSFLVINDGEVWKHKNRRFRDVMTFDETLEWHLTKNCIPDKPVCMIPVCKIAIELINSGNRETLVKLPEQISWMSFHTFKFEDEAPAIEIVEWCDLQPYCNQEAING